MSAVIIIPVRGNALYRRYSGQNAPQDCHVSLDCRKGTLTADFNPEIGNAVPFAVHHRHVQRWSIPCLTADAANALLAEIAPFAQRMLDGYECVWDGHNHVAEFSDDADDADDTIICLCDHATADANEQTTVQVWDASDWLGGLGNAAAQCEALKITAETTDDELRAIADAAEVEAAGMGVHALDGCLRHMEWLREKAIDAAE